MNLLLLPNLFSMNQYQRIGALSILEGLDCIKKGGTQRLLGVHVSLQGQRLWTYLYKGIKCVSCERQGHYFAVEKCRHGGPNSLKEKYHINLWGIDKRGNHFLMTSDHIIPKSRGGDGSLSNRQPMCIKCNNKKGHLLPGEKQHRNPKEVAHNCYQGMLKLMREKLEKELAVETIIQ